MSERESIEVDVVIVGAGPAGLSTACHLMQLAQKESKELSVVVLEKGSEVGAHILSGAVFDPKALTSLFPDCFETGAPLKTKVTRDEVFYFKSKNKAYRIPLLCVPKTMHNQGNYIVSLGEVVRWLGEKATELGVEIFPGFAAADIIYDEKDNILGVTTGEMGVSKDSEKKDSYVAGMDIFAKTTVFAEGCRGHLGKQLIEKFNLSANKHNQSYALGIKELWQINPNKHNPGLVLHGTGWPLSENNATGGSFLYHLDKNLVSVGLITDLSYKNPYLSPFEEFQRLKQHPIVSQHLQGGERISYGARAITKGGLLALPDMVLPNGLLIGCDAGTLNFSKIKGSHTAMQSGILAAKTIFSTIFEAGSLDDYKKLFQQSWIQKELYRSRNFGKAIQKFGTFFGGAYNFIDQNIFSGRLPFNFSDSELDHKKTQTKDKYSKIEYPKPDGTLSFDKNSSVYLSNTNHEEDQRIHLKLSRPSDAVKINYEMFAGLEQAFCPAGVYEFSSDEQNKIKLNINAQNCVHCKTCDIKDPTANITWVTPEGGGGPNYVNM